jgi:hypothetical protein
MRLVLPTRRGIAAFVAALAVGATACGEEEVERRLDEGAREVQEAGGKAKKAGDDVAREAKKGAKRAERELEK